MTKPTHGSTIIFTKTPIGSYASTGTPYAVEVSQGYVRLINTVTGSGTFDALYTYRMAEFATVGA